MEKKFWHFSNGENEADLELVNDPVLLSDYQTEWEELAANATEPNLFYEPWMILPALKYLKEDELIHMLFIFLNHPKDKSQRILCGFFPLTQKRAIPKTPITLLSFWEHPYCYLLTPLIRTGCEKECLNAFSKWLTSHFCNSALLKLTDIPAEGSFYKILMSHLRESSTKFFISKRHTSAFLRPKGDANTYLRSAHSRKSLKRLKCQEKAFSKIGSMSVKSLGDEPDLEKWMDDFLKLEASGWKGQMGTAMFCEESHSLFFKTILREAYRKNRLDLLILTLNEKPVAMQCNFLTKQGIAIPFKGAFDEAYSQYSPGVLLELYNIRRLHNPSQKPREIEWMDSCGTDNKPIRYLWSETRPIHSLLWSTSFLGNLVLFLYPTLRTIYRALRFKQPAI